MARAGPRASTSRAKPPPADAIMEDVDDEDEDVSDGERETDDPVIKRIPVYYTPHFINSLALLQYPDRPPRPGTQHPLLPPSLRPDANPDQSAGKATVTARYKPRSQYLEIQVPMERVKERWNEALANTLAKGLPAENGELPSVGHKGKGKQKKGAAPVAEEADEEKERATLDTLTYASHVVPDITNYLVGVVKDDALHLSPVTQTLQLRPHLSYLDHLATSERRARREAHKAVKEDADSDSDAEVSDTELKKEVARQVQVSIKQSQDAAGPGGGGGGAFGRGAGGTGRAGADLFNPLREMEGESWLKLQHYHAETPQATLAFEHMLTDEDKLDVELTSITKPSEYLKG